MNFDIRNETARGFLLLGVFFVHGLYALTYPMNDWHQAPAGFALIKLLAPQISIYFLLSGMSLRGIGQKSLRAALPQSLMLIFLACVSEGFGIIAENLLYGGYGNGLVFIKQAIKPMAYGTGGCTFVTWFFTVLAVGRMLVWLFERSKIGFAVSWVMIAGLILLSRKLHLPDNLYEWRNWPVAALFLVAGMKIPKTWQVPWVLGIGGLLAGLALTWFDVPGMWKTAPCLTCNVAFVAEPMVGSYGFLPAFLIGQAGFFLFILWVSQNPPKLAGQIGRYFGRPSLQFLLLHGWLIVTIEPVLASYAPLHDSILLLLGLLILNPILHAVLFKYSETRLNRIIAMCFGWGRSVTDQSFRMLGAITGVWRRATVNG